MEETRVQKKLLKVDSQKTDILQSVHMGPMITTTLIWGYSRYDYKEIRQATYKQGLQTEYTLSK